MNIAFCLLCVRPNRDQVSFYSRLARYGFDVYVLADCNDRPYDTPDEVTLIQIEDQESIQSGYCYFNTHLKKKPLCSAWDKGLFVFCTRLLEYDHVWLVEEDVFVPQLSSLVDIHVRNTSSDLICGRGARLSSEAVLLNNKWQHWSKLPKSLQSPPFVSAMCCASRISRRMMCLIDSFLIDYLSQFPLGLDRMNVGSVEAEMGAPFLEFTLPMLAVHNNLSMVRPPEMIRSILAPMAVKRMIEKDGYVIDDADNYNPCCIYHPVKDLSVQQRLREIISDRAGEKSQVLPNS